MKEIKYDPQSITLKEVYYKYIGGGLLLLFLAILSWCYPTIASHLERDGLLVATIAFGLGMFYCFFMGYMLSRSIKRQKVIIKNDAITFFGGEQTWSANGLEIKKKDFNEIDLIIKNEVHLDLGPHFINRPFLVFKGNTATEVPITYWDKRQVTDITDAIQGLFPHVKITTTLSEYLKTPQRS